MKIKTLLLFVLPAALIMLVVHSCKKDDILPPNPYDDIIRDDTTGNEIPIDSLTITYLHKKVLASRCALPGCHVGNFEPDFRTPQSSFSTLVYAPIVKNNAANLYKYRVVPYKTDSSVLYQRITNCCFVNNNDRMPQDDVGIPLPDSDIELVQRWIMNGARDMFGNVPRKPNTEPVYNLFAAVSMDYQTYYSNTRLDSVYFNPFIVPTSVTQFYMAIPTQYLTDDSTPIANLKYNRFKISRNMDNFSGAYEATATFISGIGWVATVNTATLVANDTLFVRYYTNDGSHAQNTEFPRNDVPVVYKTFWSFIRQ